MDEREELLRRDREREKRREQRRLQREKELRKRMIAGAGWTVSPGHRADHQYCRGNESFSKG